MLTLIHKECGGPALDESPVGEVCAIPIRPLSLFLFHLPGRDHRRIGSQAVAGNGILIRLRSSPSTSYVRANESASCW